MKRYLEAEIDDDMIKEGGMEADDYIRHEMGWMEEAGFILCGITSEEYRKANSIEAEQPPTFYFSFGSSDSYPFRGGWVEVRTDDVKQAETLFRSHFPDKHPGVLNCAFVYTEQEWRETPMAEGHGGQRCHRVIDAPGVYRRDLPKEKPISPLVKKAKERMAKRAGRAASKHQRLEQER